MRCEMGWESEGRYPRVFFLKKEGETLAFDCMHLGGRRLS